MCFLLIVAILNQWFLRQVDIVKAYTQAPIECEMYMTLPQGVLTWFGKETNRFSTVFSHT